MGQSLPLVQNGLLELLNRLKTTPVGVNTRRKDPPEVLDRVQVRGTGRPGKNIHILEAEPVLGDRACVYRGIILLKSPSGRVLFV